MTQQKESSDEGAIESVSGLEKLKLAIEVVGILLVAASIIFSAVYSSRSLDSANETVIAAKDAVELSNHEIQQAKYESAYQRQLDLWNLAAQNSELAPYIVGGKRLTDTVDDGERARSSRRAALFNALDFYAYVFDQLVPRDENNGYRPFPSPLMASVGNRPPNVPEDIWYPWSLGTEDLPFPADLQKLLLRPWANEAVFLHKCHDLDPQTQTGIPPPLESLRDRG